MSQATSHGNPSKNANIAASTSELERGKSFDLGSVYAPIQGELDAVESTLRTELTSDTPFMNQFLEHSWTLGGKRIRPALLLLTAASCGKITEPHRQMAASLELIHTATLIHDDILDNADTRRHRATANSKWGNRVSLLLGDYLFTHSFHLASLAGSAEALQMLAQASNRVCEGEMRQNAWQGDFDLTEKSYLRMITEKTAELCGVGCRIGAFLSGADAESQAGFESYGRNLGVAFQIIDDVLDVVGEPDDVGKTLGTDLINQKPTLPVIHCLEQSSPDDRATLLQMLVDQDTTADDILPYLTNTHSIGYARQIAQHHARRAVSFTHSLEANAYAASLGQLAEFVLQRTQ